MEKPSEADFQLDEKSSDEPAILGSDQKKSSITAAIGRDGWDTGSFGKTLYKNTNRNESVN